MSMFILFGLTQPRNEPEFTVSVAVALSTQPLIEYILTQQQVKHPTNYTAVNITYPSLVSGLAGGVRDRTSSSCCLCAPLISFCRSSSDSSRESSESSASFRCRRWLMLRPSISFPQFPATPQSLQ